MEDTFKNTIQRARVVAGGERGVMCRTMHKKDFKRDSHVPYFRLFFASTPTYVDDTFRSRPPGCQGHPAVHGHAWPPTATALTKATSTIMAASIRIPRCGWRARPWSCHPGGGGPHAVYRGRSRPRTTADVSRAASSCESSGGWEGSDQIKKCVHKDAPFLCLGAISRGHTAAGAWPLSFYYVVAKEQKSK